MIVVYGISHYGKANCVDRYDNCEHCGVFGKLSSYDAGAFFTIYWIPLIPLGKKHIMDSCPSCKRHRELGLGKYSKIKKQELGEAIANMRDNPDDPDKAIEGIQAFIRYNEFANFETMAAILSRKHATNPKVMNMLGAAYEYLGKLDLAETCFRQAVTAANTPENAVDLIRVLLFQGKIQEAEPWFQPIFEGRQPKNVRLIYLLVEAYRDKGQHVKALDALKKIEALDPELAKDEGHAELVETSTARMDSGQPIPSDLFHRPLGIQTRKGTSALLPSLILPGILAAIAGAYLYSCYSKGVSCPMWLVNGTTVTYTVAVNDKSYKLGPYGHTRIEAPQGDVRMAIENSPLPMEPVTVNIRTPFLSRAFDDSSIVLNPDAQAVMVKQRNTYSARDMSEQDMPYTVHVGKESYTFEDIDYEFVDFPQQISVDSSSSTVYKWRLYNLTPDEGVDPFQVAVQEFTSPELIVGFLRKRALMHPRDETALTLYCSVGMANESEDIFVTLRHGTALRPLLVDWHRMYQSIMERSKPDHDLVSEYSALVKANPQNRELMYLLGRILNDPAEAAKWFEKAEQGPHPIGFGYGALCYEQYCNGEFEKAAKLLEKALKIKPDREQWQGQYRTLLLGAERYEDLLIEIRKLRKEAPLLGSYVVEETRTLAQTGRVTEANKALDIYLAAVKAEDPECLGEWRKTIKGVIAYAGGDHTAYYECYGKSEDPNDVFAVALLKQDAAAAEKALAKIENPTYFQHLLVYCLLAHKGQSEQAGKQLDKAVELLMKGAPEHKTIVKMLRGDADLVRQRLGPLHIEPYEKRVFATAIGLAVPATRDHCFAIARRHNFDHTFPYHTLAAIVKR